MRVKLAVLKRRDQGSDLSVFRTHGLSVRTRWIIKSKLKIDKFAGLRHSAQMAKPALGRGLGALLGESPIAKPASAPASTTVPPPAAATDPRERVQRVPLDRIRPCPF